MANAVQYAHKPANRAMPRAAMQVGIGRVSVWSTGGKTWKDREGGNRRREGEVVAARADFVPVGYPTPQEIERNASLGVTASLPTPFNKNERN